MLYQLALPPVKQEETAADLVMVSAEVYEVPESEQDEENVSEDPITALAHISLRTQTGSELPCQGDPSQSPSQEITGNPGRILTLDPARPTAEIVGQLRAHLSPTWGYASGGVRVPFLDRDDLVALEGYVDQVGWVDLPLLHPKQVERTGVACLVCKELLSSWPSQKITTLTPATYRPRTLPSRRTDLSEIR